MIHSITLRLPLKVALPLMISVLVLASVSVLTVFFYVRADDAVLALARQSLQQLHERIGDRLEAQAAPDPRELTRFLRSLTVGRTGIAYVVDGQGTLLGASTADALIDSGARLGSESITSDPDSKPVALTSANPWIAGSAAALVPAFVRGSLQESRIPDRLELNGTDVMLTATQHERPGGGGSLVVTLVPVADFLSEVRKVRLQGILFAAAIVLLALVPGILLAARVTQPLAQLTEHMRRVGQGKLQDDLLLTEFPEFMRLSFAMNSMVEGLRERVKLRQSLAMAMEVQQRLLPSEVPQCPGLDIAGRSYYCDQMGGDYYDYLRIDHFPATTAVIAIGDVSGHGVASAMVMASARVVLRNRCQEARSLAELLGQMNAQIVQDSGRGRYMTMLLVAADAVQRELRWASAGHREPLLLEPGTDAFRELHGADIPLGVTMDVNYEEHRHSALLAGQLILLATDGLWEAANSAGEAYGLQRLGAVMRSHAQGTASEICGAIALDVIAFCGREAQSDDISFVVVKVTDAASRNGTGEIGRAG